MTGQLGDGNRWQGYSHQQLYEMLNSGPGARAADAAVATWSGMADSLADIQQGISAGVTASGATWTGLAGDATRGALGPFGDWAQQASNAAEMMRVRTELQSDLLGRARAEMPAPLPVDPGQPGISQLLSSQIDYEILESASNALEQRAFQVMAEYESATTDNTGSLGEFGQPPQLHVDTTPITGPPRTHRVHPVEPPKRAPVRPKAGYRAAAPVEEEPVEPKPTTPVTPEPEPATASSTPSSTAPETGTSKPVRAEPAPEPAPEPVPDSVPEPAPGTIASRLAPEPAAPEPTAPEPTAPSGAPARDTGPTTSTSSARPTTTNRSRSTGTPAPVPTASGAGQFAGAVVPAARQPGEFDDPDDEHESKYLLDADDIYGDRLTFAPPVIGETRGRP